LQWIFFFVEFSWGRIPCGEDGELRVHCCFHLNLSKQQLFRPPISHGMCERPIDECGKAVHLAKGKYLLSNWRRSSAGVVVIEASSHWGEKRRLPS